MLLIAAGLPGLIDSFARFALQGLGTPQTPEQIELGREVGAEIAKALVADIARWACPPYAPRTRPRQPSATS